MYPESEEMDHTLFILISPLLEFASVEINGISYIIHNTIVPKVKIFQRSRSSLCEHLN